MRSEAVESRFVLPMSPAQQRLWIQEQLTPGAVAYNIPAVAHITGPLDGAALERSLREIIARHEILRTTFGTLEGRLVQLIAPATDFQLPTIDLSNLDDAARGQAVERLTSEHVEKPFDLARGPLVRAQLLRLAGEEHILLMAMHHITGDGWSVEIFFRELEALYAGFRGGSPAALPEPAFQYADFAVWQQEWLESGDARRQAEYWRRQLSGAPPFLRLPTDFPRPEATAPPVASHAFALDSEQVGAMEKFARGRGATLFMAALTAFQVVLHYLSNEEDIVIGTDIANRARLETENLIGFFANQLVLRASMAGDPTWEELLDRARETTLAGYAHQDLPFDRVVEEVKPERSLQYSPLFQVKLVLQNAPGKAFSLPGLTVRVSQPEARSAKFDLLMNLAETAGGLAGLLQYRRDLFVPASAARIVRLFEAACNMAARDAGAKLSATCGKLAAMERNQRLEDLAKALAARKNNLSTIRRRSVAQA